MKNWWIDHGNEIRFEKTVPEQNFFWQKTGAIIIAAILLLIVISTGIASYNKTTLVLLECRESWRKILENWTKNDT